MTTTTTFDFTPLYRHAVGFDRFANMAQKLVEQQLAGQRISDTCKAKISAAKNAGMHNTKVNHSDVKNTQATGKAANKTSSQATRQAEKRAVKTQTDANYPRYNISQFGELDYQISLALAGFSLAEIDITVTANELVIIGKKQPEEQIPKLLHQGINQADFTRTFALADHVHVVGAEMQQGLLTINLERKVPEALKPRKVSIGA